MKRNGEANSGLSRGKGKKGHFPRRNGGSFHFHLARQTCSAAEAPGSGGTSFRWGSSRQPLRFGRTRGTRQTSPCGSRAGHVPLSLPAEDDRGRSQRGGRRFFAETSPAREENPSATFIDHAGGRGGLTVKSSLEEQPCQTLGTAAFGSAREALPQPCVLLLGYGAPPCGRERGEEGFVGQNRGVPSRRAALKRFARPKSKRLRTSRCFCSLKGGVWVSIFSCPHFPSSLTFTNFRCL